MSNDHQIHRHRCLNIICGSSNRALRFWTCQSQLFSLSRSEIKDKHEEVITNEMHVSYFDKFPPFSQRFNEIFQVILIAQLKRVKISLNTLIKGMI